MMKSLFIAVTAMLCVMSANAKSYKQGDYYEENGLKGIVVRVDATGEHGLIMSLNICSKKWLDDSDDKLSTNCFYEDDGEKNMAVAEKYINENGKYETMNIEYKTGRKYHQKSIPVTNENKVCKRKSPAV